MNRRGDTVLVFLMKPRLSVTRDSNDQYGLVLWLGTKDKKKAEKLIKAIENIYNTGEKATKGKRK